MKITNRMIITALPNGSTLKETAVGMTIDLMSAKYFTVPEAIELRDALTAMINHLSRDDDQTSPARREWGEGDIIPDDVMKVSDSAGDTWARRAQNSAEWSLVRFRGERVIDGFPAEESELLEQYGPVTEVRP